MEYAPPPFFQRGPAPLARLTFFALLSVLLMVLDARFGYAEPMRQLPRSPSIRCSARDRAGIGALATAASFSSRKRGCGARTRAARREAQGRARQLLALEGVRAENEQLTQLLAARERLAGDSIFAEIVYAGRDPFSRKVIIDRGGQHGVSPGSR